MPLPLGRTLVAAFVVLNLVGANMESNAQAKFDQVSEAVAST